MGGLRTFPSCFITMSMILLGTKDEGCLVSDDGLRVCLLFSSSLCLLVSFVCVCCFACDRCFLLHSLSLIVEFLYIKLPRNHQSFFRAQVLHVHKILDKNHVRYVALRHDFPQVPTEHLQNKIKHHSFQT